MFAKVAKHVLGLASWREPEADLVSAIVYDAFAGAGLADSIHGIIDADAFFAPADHELQVDQVHNDDGQ